MKITNMVTTNKSGRIEYIDAIRGYAILLVIFCHVFTFCFGRNLSVIANFFSDFMLPLFFCVSGFCVYKKREWSAKELAKFVYRKALALLIPAIVFFYLFELLIAHNFIVDIMHTSKGGYWFTIALFWYYLLYSVTNGICNRLKVKEQNTLFVLLFLAVLLYFICPVVKLIGITSDFDWMCVMKLKLFVYFVFGIFLRRYNDYFNRLAINQTFISAVMVVALSFYIVHLRLENNGVLNSLYPIIISISGILFSFVYFINNEKIFSSDTKLGKVFQFVGKRTLDIYLIHYFVLPLELEFIGDYFFAHSMPLLYFFIGVLVAIYVIVISLGISHVIRLSPTLSKVLFGSKN